uniref:Uncharacterized protein n=1 Tax=Caenorhabditis japonica TaxID=281687 RepID=A0A8R1J158_CAEJA
MSQSAIPPRYSPDLAPTDYHLVSDMQRFLEGTDFKTISDVENWIVSYFASKKSEFWKTGTMSLQNRWHTVVDKEVKYYYRKNCIRRAPKQPPRKSALLN